MDQARLQGSNLGYSEEGREILASVQSLCSAPSVRVRSGRISFDIHVAHKVAFLSEESFMYMILRGKYIISAPPAIGQWIACFVALIPSRPGWLFSEDQNADI